MSSYASWMYESIGDGLVSVLSEIKFWGEVVSEYMEWDASSAQRIANEYRKEVRE